MARKSSTNKAEAPVVQVAQASSQPSVEQQQQVTHLQYIEGQLAGVQLHDGTVVSLADLPETDLRKIATDMEIDGADTLALDQLVIAIQAEPILVNENSCEATGDNAGVSSGPTSVSAGEALPHLAGEDGRYQVLLTDGSLAYLEELSKEDLIALATACFRLVPVGLGGAQFIGLDLAGDDDVQIVHTATGEASRYVVRRERLDHNDESYALGEVIQFDDDEQARQLLAIGAIVPEVL